MPDPLDSHEAEQRRRGEDDEGHPDREDAVTTRRDPEIPAPSR